MKNFFKLMAGMIALVTTGMGVTQISSTFAADAVDPHAAHHHMMMSAMSEGTKTSTAEYGLPPIKLVRDDGKAVLLPDELNDGRAVVINFIYTSCTQICPVTSRTFMQLQEKLGNERSKVHLVSISIDPEQDTPAVLRGYAKRFEAGSGWRYYTGTAEASIATQRAFDVYRGDKMNHAPVTLLRAAPGKPWTRIEGFASADDLLGKYREITGSK
jgi:protein SCO1/2